MTGFTGIYAVFRAIKYTVGVTVNRWADVKSKFMRPRTVGVKGPPTHKGYAGKVI